MENYLTLEETAGQLKVEVSEILPLIEAGKLRAIRIGESIRVPEGELANLLVTSAAGPSSGVVADTTKVVSVPRNSRLVRTRSGRAMFRVSGSLSTGVEIWAGNMRYPIKFPKAFLEDLLAHFSAEEIAVGGSFDGPSPGSLGEFVQRKLETKMNPAVYVAALLIEEGYAVESRRGYIRFIRR